MQQVFYPGHAGQPFVGEYAIVIDKSDMFSRADVVLITRREHGGASFLTGNFGRDAVFNRILVNDLSGIRLQWIRLFVLYERSALMPGGPPRFIGREIKDIVLDTDDFVARGNPCIIRSCNIFSRLITGISREISYWSGHVAGGCARFSTSLQNARHLDEQEIETLCARIGLRPPTPETAQPSVRTGSRLATRNAWSSSSYH